MTPTVAELVETELSKRWYEPASAWLRALYNEKREAPRRRNARFTMWIAAVIYIAFALLDFVLIPDVAPATATARLVLGIGAFATVEVLILLRAKADRFDVVCGGVVVVCYIAWLMLASFSEHTLSVSYYMVFGTIFMMVVSLFFNFQPLPSFAASFVVMMAFFCAMIFVIPVSLTYELSFGTFYVSCFGFTSYMNWKLNVERYSVFLNALQAQIRQDEVAERGRDLLRLSITDPLTGLENRRSIDERLRRHWERWQNAGEGFAAILIDIDFFKSFNDYYGHQEGDRCLVLVANALAEAIKPYGGSIGRYGGEEFIVLAPVQEEARVVALAETVRRTAEDLAIRHQQRRDGEFVVTVSVGAAFTRRQIGPKLERLINEADRALYAAKASGRNCARLFDPSDPQSNDESENIAALLRIAVAQDLVSLVYQPIQNVASGEVEAVEALMRLRMLDGTPIAPCAFIPVAERTGAILELGRWAIRTVCRDLLANDRVPLVSVNVSAVQLKTPGFSSSVAAILGETGVTGRRLAFEITEGLEIEAHSDVLRCISELKRLGIRIWLDDFGTGFAGLSWLRLIDFDTVKIDRSFLHDSAAPKGLMMLQDIIGLIRHRGHRMIVEGVETEAQMALMRDCGIDRVQGFHVGRPAAAETFRPPPAKRPVSVGA